MDAELPAHGGTLVTERDVYQADLAIRDGRVAAILAPSVRPTVHAQQALDDTGALPTNEENELNEVLAHGALAGPAPAHCTRATV